MMPGHRIAPKRYLNLQLFPLNRGHFREHLTSCSKETRNLAGEGWQRNAGALKAGGAAIQMDVSYQRCTGRPTWHSSRAVNSIVETSKTFGSSLPPPCQPAGSESTFDSGVYWCASITTASRHLMLNMVFLPKLLSLRLWQLLASSSLRSPNAEVP